MHRKVLKVIAFVCSTACLYIVIALTSHPKPYLFEYNKYSKQVFAVSADSVPIAYDYKCCPQLSADTTTQTSIYQSVTSSDKRFAKDVNRVVSVDSQGLNVVNDNNSTEQLISTQINQNDSKSVDNNSYRNVCDFHIAIIFTITDVKSNSNKLIDKKLYRSLTSIAKHINHKKQTICVNVITDQISRLRAKSLLKLIDQKPSSQLKSIDANINGLVFAFHDINDVNAKIAHLLPALKSHFTYKPNSYYSHSLFFTSLAIHQFLTSVDKLIFLDIDVQLNDNIAELYRQFSSFSATALIGLAFEQQPVYRHILHDYRHRIDNETRLGSPAPEGWPGFNSGVLLMDLKRIRESNEFNSLLTVSSIDNICEKYFFSGHLGDQDFYTVVSFQYQHLFHVIPCNWNRQLCQWWRYHGYSHVFDMYFKCDLKIKLFHGNCNSVMPSMH